jgi:hypothetical protein
MNLLTPFSSHGPLLTKHIRRHFRSSALALAGLLSLAALTSCGAKDSVDDNESGQPDGPVRNGDRRSRLTGGGTPSGVDNSVSYCRLPLDMGTVVDPRRPGLMQTVLMTNIDSRCATYQDLRLTVKSKFKITLAGKFICRAGIQFNEQVCTGTTFEHLSAQKNSVLIPLIIEDGWRASDVEATIEFL